MPSQYRAQQAASCQQEGCAAANSHGPQSQYRAQQAASCQQEGCAAAAAVNSPHKIFFCDDGQTEKIASEIRNQNCKTEPNSTRLSRLAIEVEQNTMRQREKSRRVQYLHLAFVVISCCIGPSLAFQQPQPTSRSGVGNRIRTASRDGIARPAIITTSNFSRWQTCLRAHHYHNHHKLTWREVIIGSSPLIRTLKYVYSRARTARWLRAKRKKHQEEEDNHSGITKGFVDAAHSSWASRFCTAYISIYMLLSVVAYSFIFEKWSIVNSLYFATTTFTSVGYGDLCPQTRGGRLFTVFFALYGISILGIALGYIGRNLVEAEAGAVEAAEQRIVDALQGRFHRHNAIPLQQMPLPLPLVALRFLVTTSQYLT